MTTKKTKREIMGVGNMLGLIDVLSIAIENRGFKLNVELIGDKKVTLDVHPVVMRELLKTIRAKYGDS